MNILIASDKFKGSLTASEACEAIATGIRAEAGDSTHSIRCLPIADGGDGLAETLLSACGGVWVEKTVSGPLGDPVRSGYALIDNGRTAVIEMAKASGLALLGNRPNDPRRASTKGTGELIADAMRHGVDEIVLGIGGSATNDGGAGLAEALGFRFEDSSGHNLTGMPSEIEQVARIVPPLNLRLPRVTVACDVTNPLLGSKGCTRVYGPQKGIAPADLASHEARLARLVALSGEAGKVAAICPGAGAAGGLGFGALVFLNAELTPGFDLVAEKLDLGAAIEAADLVITGEGRLDSQSLQGKGPHGVARRARARGRLTAAFCGSLESGNLENEFGPVTVIADPGLDLPTNLARGRELLEEAAKHFARTELVQLASMP
ncbi:MAG: glycerate kinase [Verrucomicrobiae bacterium]|nr:glycerate kinase [Verrucomicrobiae bacterium]